MKTKSPTQSKGKTVEAWAIMNYGVVQLNRIYSSRKMAKEELEDWLHPEHCGTCECDNSDLDIKIIPITLSYHLPKKSLSATKDK